MLATCFRGPLNQCSVEPVSTVFNNGSLLKAVIILASNQDTVIPLFYNAQKKRGKARDHSIYFCNCTQAVVHKQRVYLRSSK